MFFDTLLLSICGLPLAPFPIRSRWPCQKYTALLLRCILPRRGKFAFICATFPPTRTNIRFRGRPELTIRGRQWYTLLWSYGGLGFLWGFTGHGGKQTVVYSTTFKCTLRVSWYWKGHQFQRVPLQRGKTSSHARKDIVVPSAKYTV